MNYLKKTAKKILQYEATLVLMKYRPKVIAITGSVGKTLTKEAIYSVLSKKFFVRKNERSFTAELGVPLAILGCADGAITPIQVIKNIFFALKLIFFKKSYPDWLLLEIDGDKPGDFAFINSFLSVDILVMTAIGDVPSHVESFFDVHKFLLEKRFIINSVKSDGVIIYNADDSQVLRLLEEVETVKISCGLGENYSVNGSDFNILYGKDGETSVPTGMSFEITGSKFKNEISIYGSIGIHNEYACLLAFAVGLEFGLKPREISGLLNKYKTPNGRMNIINGLKDTVIIDDSYNSSPIAVSQALSVVGDIKTNGKKIVVLGDMLELGKYSADEHRKLAVQLKDTATKIISVGFRMEKLVDELIRLGFNRSDIVSVDSSLDAGQKIVELIDIGDIILIKGSQSMRMERIVGEIMKHPKDRKKLLVRQDAEWLGR